MNNKEIHIEIPDGFILDEEKYKNNIIAFLPKPIDPLAHLPKSWEELKKIQDWYLNASQAEAILALCQLLQLRDRYNDGEQLIINSRNERYCIWNACGKIKTITYATTNCILKFKTKELRDHFLQHHIALIEKAKELL